MIFEEIIKVLECNSFYNLCILKEIFIYIATTILNHPNYSEVSILPKSHSKMRNILSWNGGKLMLLHMGYMEKKNVFEFPHSKKTTQSGEVLILYHLKNIRKQLLEWKPFPRASEDQAVQEITENMERQSWLDSKAITPRYSEPFVNRYKNPFLHRLSRYFYNAQMFNYPILKERARQKIPIIKFEVNIQNSLRSFQRLSKEGIRTFNSVNLPGIWDDDFHNNLSDFITNREQYLERQPRKLDDSSIIISDLLLLELLRWFKEEFFTWMDSPRCENCNIATTFSHSSSDINLMKNANNVEMFICEGCWQLVPFRRFNDLNILLETRTGRCGEWANVFTLMCYAMGFDARIVVDETDHVWTEVYSHFRKQWVHCDPCEKVYDTPLMYEHGWGKELSYVIAYSPYELQDVTWRYSSQHKNILKRRNLCPEHDLINAIVQLRNDRLKNFSPTRRMYILKRCVQELVELLQERQPKDLEMRGRTSGDLSWRIARGEIGETSNVPFTFNISCKASTSTSSNKIYNVKYCCAADKYIIDGDEMNSFNSWHRGVYAKSNIMRKEEHDWKQVYLCRTEGAKTGYITWNFKLIESRIIRMRLRILIKVFENGEVTIKLSGDNGKKYLLTDDKIIETDYFKGCTSLLIEACLTGGKGNEAWQHAQLFRQPLCSEDYAFELEIEHS